MEQFNITMRKFLKEAGVTSQQAIERVVREENLVGNAASPARTGSLSNDDLVAREDRRGSYTVPGLGSRKQAILKAGGNTLDIAIAMLETETMLTDYAYGKQVMALSAISSMSIY